MTEELVTRMREAGVPEAAIRAFGRQLALLAAGSAGFLDHDAISPVKELPDAATLGRFRPAGERALGRLAVVRLNGGLGTAMGLERAKSLLVVRDGFTFLDLIARQVLALREATGADIPLLLMNSFRTEKDSLEALAPFADLGLAGLPLSFVQHQVPKILASTLAPANAPGRPELEWCPPGHGDLFLALATSGVLGRLLERGVDFAFVANADNVGAQVDTALLGFMVENGVDLLLEAADRSESDRKGGHLCRLRDGRLALREAAQCPPGEEAEFQNVALYRYFNTNSLWLHLPSLDRLLASHDGVLPLPPIFNRKTLDPRDPTSPAVVQLETAMGSALTVFPRATAVRVPRARFSPVKTTDDLLAVRSDAYELLPDGRVALDPSRSSPPTVALDSRHYRFVDELERRFPSGPPSLRRCESLRVTGDVTFGAGVAVVGRVHVQGPGEVAAGAELSGEVVLGKEPA